MFFLFQKRLNVLFFFLKILLVSTFVCQSISADEVQNKEYQLEVNPQWYSTENYAVQGVLGLSRKNSIDNRNRVYMRPSVAYGVTSEITARVGLFAGYNNFSELQDSLEVRPYVGVNYYHDFDDTFSRWSLSGYFRIEDRLRYATDTWENEQHLRARLRLWGIYTLNPISKEDSWHRVILGAELLRTYFNKDEKLIELDDTFDVESRVSLSIERTLKDKQKIRFDLSWRYQVPFNEIDESKFSTVVFRIRYYPAWGDLFSNILSRNVDE